MALSMFDWNTEGIESLDLRVVVKPSSSGAWLRFAGKFQGDRTKLDFVPLFVYRSLSGRRIGVLGRRVGGGERWLGFGERGRFIQVARYHQTGTRTEGRADKNSKPIGRSNSVIALGRHG